MKLNEVSNFLYNETTATMRDAASLGMGVAPPAIPAIPNIAYEEMRSYARRIEWTSTLMEKMYQTFK